MSYPDEWNQVHDEADASDAVMQQTLDQSLRQHSCLTIQKDAAIKNGDYEAAAKLRDRMDDIKSQLRKAEKATHPLRTVNMSDKPMKNSALKNSAPGEFKKALVVSDPESGGALSDDSSFDLQTFYEADLVITESGRLIKSRYTKVPEQTGELHEENEENQRLKREVQALEAWQNVAAQSNRDIAACLKKRFPNWVGTDLGEGMPANNVRQAIQYLDVCIQSKYHEEVDFSINWAFMKLDAAERMLELLSGDLNYDNVAKAKKILKTCLG